MALYQPTNIVPSSFSGEGAGVVSASDNVSISWQINGTSALYGFRIYIYRNNSASTLVYSSPNTVRTGCPAYGRDAKGNPITFTYAPTGVKWSDWGLGNGINYKMKIRQYQTASSYIDMYADAAFITKVRPTLNIYPFSSPVHSIVQTVKATYSQSGAEAINWVRWQFYAVDGSAETLIDDTGRIYTGVLEYTCTGLLNGNRYKIACSAGTQSGYSIEAAPVYFYARYDSGAADEIDVECAGDGAVLIRTGTGNTIPAKKRGSGSYAVSGGTLTIDANTVVYWDEVNGSDMYFAHPFSLSWQGGVSTAGAGDILDVSSGNIHLSNVGNQLVLSSDLTEIEYIVVPQNATSATVTITQNNFKAEFNAGGTVQKTVSYVQQPIHALALYGAQTCGKFTVYGANNKAVFAPTFITNADGGATGESSNGTALYRATSGEASATKVYTLAPEQTAVKDYGIPNGAEFQYTAFGISSDYTYSTPSISETYCSRQNGYWLIEGKQDDNDVNIYHVVDAFKFDGNINDTQISNNNQPQFLTNFTPYQYRQPSTVMGKSGTLQALIGNAVNGEYTGDTTARMEKIFALSASKNVLFLKDLKGNVFMVHTASPIVQTINVKQPVQSVTVSISWKEIGDMTGISLVQTQDDEGWESEAENEVANVLGNVDVETGELSFTYPTSYFGTTFGLYGGKLTATTPPDASSPELTYDAPYLYTENYGT